MFCFLVLGILVRMASCNLCDDSMVCDENTPVKHGSLDSEDVIVDELTPLKVEVLRSLAKQARIPYNRAGNKLVKRDLIRQLRQHKASLVASGVSLPALWPVVSELAENAVDDVDACVPADTGLASGADVLVYSMAELSKMNQKELRSHATRHRIKVGYKSGAELIQELSCLRSLSFRSASVVAPG